MKLAPPGHQIVIPEWIPISGFEHHVSKVVDRFYVNRDYVLFLEEKGPPDKFLDTNLVCDCLMCPKVILEGLKRENYAAGLCFCSLPAERWVDEIERRPAPAGWVFCVYVNPTPAGFFVLDWDWRSVGPGGTDIPDNWQRDFERIVWRTN